jgi:hypothetical protein
MPGLDRNVARQLFLYRKCTEIVVAQDWTLRRRNGCSTGQQQPDALLMCASSFLKGEQLKLLNPWRRKLHSDSRCTSVVCLEWFPVVRSV